jgi:rRNA-processing protein FCF1
VAALAGLTGKLFVTSDLYERFKDKSYGDIELRDVLQTIDYSDKDIRRIAPEYNLAEEAAKLLAARFKRAKVTLLTDDGLLQKAALERKVVVVSYDEFTASLAHNMAS